MKLALISLEGTSSLNILKEAQHYFDEVTSLNLKHIHVQTTPKEISIVYKGKLLDEYDCVYLRGSYKYELLQRSIARALHKKIYMPIHYNAFTLGHNKLLTSLELQKYNIPIPKTHFAATTAIAKQLLSDLHYPIIIKIPSGTQGKGVMFADSSESALSMLDALDAFQQPYVIQEYIDTDNTDIRALVVGGRVVAAMQRTAAPGDMRANLHKGGTAKPIELHPDTEQLAIKTARVLGADICGVDILQGLKPSVLEVNLSPGLQGLTKATNINSAKIIAQHLHEQTQRYKATNKKTATGEVMKIIDKNDAQQMYSTMHIKNGMIQLPKIVTPLSGFSLDQDVVIKISKGKIVIENHSISKDDW